MKSHVKKLIGAILVLLLTANLFSVLSFAGNPPRNFGWYVDGTNKGTSDPSGYFGYDDIVYGLDTDNNECSISDIIEKNGYESVVSVMYRGMEYSYYCEYEQHIFDCDANLTVYFQGHRYETSDGEILRVKNGNVVLDGFSPYILCYYDGVTSTISSYSDYEDHMDTLVADGGTISLCNINVYSECGNALSVNGGTVKSLSNVELKSTEGVGLYIGTNGTVTAITDGYYQGFINENKNLTGFISGGTFDFTTDDCTYDNIRSSVKAGSIARLDQTDGNGLFAVVANSEISSGTYMEEPVCAKGYSYEEGTYNGYKTYTVSETIIPAEEIQFDSDITLDVSQKEYTLSYSVIPATCNETVMWKSSDSDVAAVEDGKIKLLHWGICEITAYTKTGASAKCTLTVTDTNNGYYYITDSNFKYPEIADKLYSGMFYITEGRDVTDSDIVKHDGGTYRYPYVGSEIKTNAFAFLKYISKDMLNVKAQTTLTQDSTLKSADIRLISTVDNLCYRKVGFIINVGDKTISTESKNVYTEIFGSEQKYIPSDIYSKSQYFFTYTLKNVPLSSYEDEIKITPYFVTADGNTIYGRQSIKTVKGNAGYSFTVNSLPDKYVYGIGDEFDINGCKIQLNNSGEIITVGNENICGFDSSKAGTNTLTVTYKGETAEMDIEIIDNTESKFKIANAFNSHMVLQRNAKTPVFGFGDDGDIITVKFNGQTIKTTVKDGKWSVSFEPMKENCNGQTLSVTSMANDKTVEYEDILVGDVWLTSGQSNMFMRIGDIYSLRDHGNLTEGFKNQKEYRKYYKEYAKNSLVRACWQEPGETPYLSDYNGNNPYISATPYEDLTERMDWKVCNVTDVDGSLDWLSAYAVSFALQLQPKVGVPVGVLTCAQGSTSIKEWLPMDRGGIHGVPNRPDGTEYGNMYNTMIYPLRNFAFRGLLWYQGESDAIMEGYNTGFSSIDYDSEGNRVDTYGKNLETLIDVYKTQTTQCEDGIFYYLETDIGYCPLTSLEDAWYNFRGNQASYIINIPNSDLVQNPNELGMTGLLHPIYKYTLGGYAAEKAYNLINK